MSLDCPDTQHDGDGRRRPPPQGAWLACQSAHAWGRVCQGDALPGAGARPGSASDAFTARWGKGEGRFAPISWEQALELIYTRFTAIMQEFGPQAILPLNYAGPHGFLAGGSMDLRFFHKLGASRLARRPLCGGVKGEAFVGTFGAVPLMRPEHVAQARLIIAWGNNVTVSQLHLMPLINSARKQGRSSCGGRSAPRADRA